MTSSLLWHEPYFVSLLHLELCLWSYLGFCFDLFVVCLVLFCFVWAFFISKSEFCKVNILALIISVSGEEFKSLCRSILSFKKWCRWPHLTGRIVSDKEMRKDKAQNNNSKCYLHVFVEARGIRKPFAYGVNGILKGALVWLNSLR